MTTSWQKQKFGEKKKEEPVLHKNITCFSFNGDRTMIAVVVKGTRVHIYETNNTDDTTKWTKKWSLKEHTKLVMDVDWAPKTNRIVTASQDRNAYVWDLVDDKKGGKEWKPALVLLKIQRAATCCRWSAEENKFVVGSGGKLVSVCFFDKENNWWVAKQIKKNAPHRSTISTVAFHPTDNLIMATGCCDLKARLFTAFIKDVDPKEKKQEFAKVLGEFASKGWVHDVVFSPSGNLLAFTGHDSTLTIVDVASAKEVASLPTQFLPFKKLLWLSENAIVAGGHDFTPIVFSDKEGSWKCYGKVEKDAPKEEKRTVGTTTPSTTEGIQTRHKNCINSIAYYKKSKDVVSDFVTGSLDGRVLFWKVADIEKNVSGFKV